MLGRLLSMTSRICGNVLHGKSQYKNIKPDNNDSNVFLWHADRLCAKKANAAQSLALCRHEPKTKSLMIITRGPKFAQVVKLKRWYKCNENWRPGNFHVANQGLDLPRWCSITAAKNSWVVVAVRVLFCIVVLYLITVCIFTSALILIVTSLDKMKR